jgi:hypothetical protein
VDRSSVLPPEPDGSNELSASDADLVLDNNGTLADLRRAITRAVAGTKGKGAVVAWAIRAVFRRYT